MQVHQGRGPLLDHYKKKGGLYGDLKQTSDFKRSRTRFGLAKPHSPLIATKQFFDLYQSEKIELPVRLAARPYVPAGFPEASVRAINADLFIDRDASESEALEMIRAYLDAEFFGPGAGTFLTDPINDPQELKNLA